MQNKQTEKTILIVEDDIPVLKVLHDKFTREGYRVLQARDGEDGLKTALNEHPDLILLDIIIPKMDGLTMMKKLRAENSFGKSVPVIILSNLDPDAGGVNLSITEGEPTDYLVKTDWSINALVEKIKKQLA
jgi:DNA-binding response OmpR family regulator